MSNGLLSTYNYIVPAAGTTHGYQVSGVLSATPIRVDFRDVSISGQQFIPSGVFIDNSQGTGPITISFQETAYQIQCAAGQAFQTQYPATAAQTAMITGLGQASVIFVDFPVIPFVNAGGTAATTVVISPSGNQIQGNVASQSADSGNPVKVGGRFNLGQLTVMDGQRVDLQTDVRGNLLFGFGTAGAAADGLDNSLMLFLNNKIGDGYTIVTANMYWNGTKWDRVKGSTGDGALVKPFALTTADWTYAPASAITNTTAVVVKAAAGAGVRNYLTGMTITNSSGTIATEVVVLDGATVIWRGFVGSNLLLNSAVGVTFPTPLRSTANAALSVQCITTGASVYFNAQGYTAP